MTKGKFILLCIGIEALIIAAIFLANHFGKPAFYIFYNGLYGIALSLALPLYYIKRYREAKESIGLTRFGKRQLIVVILFVLFSIGGQSITLVMDGTAIQWDLLLICIVPLIMTAFFEEFLFRGFIQTRLEKMFGIVPAIIVSGLMFSLYHLGYPGFRNFESLTLLFVVGMGFGLAYKLSGNNLLAACLVNPPNAIFTYLLNSAKFPEFDGYTSIIAGATIVACIMVLLRYRRSTGKNTSPEYSGK